MKNHLKIMKNHVFSLKGCFFEKKKPPAGLHHTDHRAGDAPKTPFHQNPLKINKNPKINPPSTITIPESGVCVCGFFEGFLCKVGEGFELSDLQG